MKDRFGNPIDPLVRYARGKILRSSTEEMLRRRWAFNIIKRRIEADEGLYSFIGVTDCFIVKPEDLKTLAMDTALSYNFLEEDLRRLAIGQTGGKPDDEVFVFNRVTAGNIAVILALAKKGGTVVCACPRFSHSHPSIYRGAALAGADCVEVHTSEALERVLKEIDSVSLFVVTGITAELAFLPSDVLEELVKKAKEKRIAVYMDDAYGAMMRPVIFKQPRTRELADVGIFGCNKAGHIGPRLGVVVGRKDLMSRISAKALELGMDARPPMYVAAARALQEYDPKRMIEDVKVNEEYYRCAEKFYGKRVKKMPAGMVIRMDDVLEILMEKAMIKKTEIVPMEACSAVAMSLLDDYGILTVTSTVMPGSGSSLRFSPRAEVARRFGSAEKAVEALNSTFDKIATRIVEPDKIAETVLGSYSKTKT